jgi:hypothetical protein
MSPPTSLWKEEGWVHSLLAGGQIDRPTSYNRGEGLLARLTRELGGGKGEGGGRGRREGERTSTMMQLM